MELHPTVSSVVTGVLVGSFIVFSLRTFLYFLATTGQEAMRVAAGDMRSMVLIILGVLLFSYLTGVKPSGEPVQATGVVADKPEAAQAGDEPAEPRVRIL